MVRGDVTRAAARDASGDRVAGAVGGPTVASAPAVSVADSTPDDASGADEDTVVAIRVSHGSLEEAEYAVMVATYEDETLSGAERFLDRQLGGLLSATYEAGSYPGPFDGGSLFLPPHPDVERRSAPPGTYIVGLGRSVDLTRARVRHAVARALVDRCLQIENWPPDCTTDAGGREVGVSSTLLGMRAGDGISVSESVTGIVEGVIDANRSLARYEAAREQSGAASPATVRITELELIERFGDRADLAAMVVRRLPNAIQLGAGYVETLADVVVGRKRGGLPAGAALADGPNEWRRFSITSVGHAEEDVENDDPATLVFDVSFLGGEARADRALHRLDRVVVDALAARLSAQSGDAASAATLYDLLVPEQMRHRFQTAPSVQLIVDETSANYPWELLSAPTAAGRTALATQGAVIRQFSEMSSRRIVVERATRGTMLVIGAGNVPSMTPLPGALREASQVRDLLVPHLAAGGCDYFDDSASDMSTVDVVNALDGDHQIIHIASHGEYVEDDPASTGALINREFRLRVETVRQLRHVPDLVFLNCCVLGRVGTARLAAGLAREFMAIGTRAVIAAGWPVGDVAAETFATTFYRHLLDGVNFAAAVAAARNATFATGGRETWAAYQCYGDPELVLDGGAGRVAVDESDPVSLEDLLRRLKSLEVRVSDLGRPGAGRLDRRRDLLVQRLERYASWAESHGMLAPASSSSDEQRAGAAVQRQLARVAAELGQFRAAAARYLSLVSPPSAGTSEPGWALGRRWSNVEDLQQASNCLSRAAQQGARAEMSTASHVERIAELEQAVNLARRAVEITGEDESYAILGGALKRLATVVPDGRDHLIRQAADAYERRHETIGDDAGASASTDELATDTDVPYRRATAAQLALLLDRSQPEPDASAPASATAPARIDSRAPSYTDYWASAAAGDQMLTRLLAARPDDDPAATTTAMIAAYERAFGGRSTWRERASSIDHLCDLRDLLDEGDDRRAQLDEGINALIRWERDNVEAAGGGG